jgi:hypothetical protein
MQQDSDVRSLKPGEYRKLTNGSPVQPKSSTVTIGDNISSIYGNALIAFSLPSGTNKVVGFVEDRKSNRAFYAVANDTAANVNDSIYQYKDGAITLVFRSALLGFSQDDFVDMDITGDHLILTNNLSEVKKINVTSAISGSVYTPLLEEITLVKKSPIYPPTLVALSTGRTTNNVKFNSIQIYARYIYSDNEYSTFGPTSLTFLQDQNYDTVQVTLNETPPATVIKVQWAVRINGGSEVLLYRTEETPLVSSTHNFYNDTALETISDSESVKLNDDVPRYSRSVKIMKNRLFLFGNTEGYTCTGVDLPSVVLSLTSAPGTTGDAVVKSDGVYGVAIGFLDEFGRIIGIRKGGDISVSELSGPTSIFLAPVLTPQYIRVGLGLVSINEIPTEATHYVVLRTKNKKTSYFISGLTSDTYYRFIKADGSSTYSKGDNTAGTITNDDLMIDISTLPVNQMGYTFNQGDYIKVWWQKSSSVYGIVNLPIKSQEGRFIVCSGRGIPFFNNTSGGDLYLFEIYTPKSIEVEKFYEVGAKYAINNPGTGSRSFSNLTVDIHGDVYATLPASIASYSGGGYSNTLPYDNTYTVLSGSDRIYGMSIAGTSDNINRFWNIWVDQTGREFPYDSDGFYQRVKVSIRFSNPYNFESKVLGLNTFDALDDQLLPIENGECTRLAEAGEVLVGIHTVEATAIYVGQGFVQTADSNASTFLTKTDQVIGDFIKYGGGHGSIHPASVVTRNEVVYWLDSRRGTVVRRSQNGLTPISELYGMKGTVASLCAIHEALGSDSRIIAGWDPQYESYCLSFIKISDDSGYTLYFHEKTNSWIFQTQIKPEFWGVLNLNQLAFKAGALWSQTIEANYNNFFGVQYDRSLEFELGSDSLEKIWEAVEVDAESIYATAGANEDVLLLYHTNGGIVQNRINYLDFKLRGSAWRSSVFGNLNDANYTTGTESKYKSRHNTRGQSAFLVITYNGTDKNPMKSISLFFRPSLNTVQ